MSMIVLQPESPLVTTEEFDRFEAELAKYQPMEEILKHYFANGMYARELTIPAGSMLTGKIHRYEHLASVSSGEVTVWSKQYGVCRIKAPCTFVSASGTRRVIYAHTDTIWTTFHVTDKTDLEEIEEEIIVKHVNPFIEEGVLCLGYSQERQSPVELAAL